MKRYAVKRMVQLVPILFGITILSYALMNMAAGDAVDMIYENTGGVLPGEILAARRAELGLDQPFPVQYARWLYRIARGDMGVSYISGRPVFETFIMKLPNTIWLSLSSLMLTAAVSLPLGILAAVKQNRPVDILIRFFCFVGNAMPNFFVSLLLLLVFAVRLSWFPVMGNGNGIRSLILPSVTLALAMSAKYVRQVRSAVLKEYYSDYVYGARARGIKEQVILYGSVLRTALLSVLTLFALSVGSLLGGTAIVESIFMWDGIGKLAVDAISMRDYPIIQSYVMWMAFIYVGLNLITDLLYCCLDPRVRLGENR